MIRRFALIAFLFLAPLAAATSGYWTATIDYMQVAEVTDYVTVELSIAPSGFWTALSDISDTTGDSIRVYAGDDSTALDYYVVAIDTTGHTGRLLIDVGDMSTSTDAVYYIHAGDSGLSAASDSAAVFSGTNVKAFYSLTGSDALVNLVNPGTGDLTAYNSPIAEQAGPVEGTKSYQFAAASSQYLQGAAQVTNWPFTMVAFIKNSTFGAVYVWSSTGNSGSSSNNSYGYTATTTGRIVGSAGGNGGSGSTATTTTNLSTGTWYDAFVARDATSGTTTAGAIGVSSATDTTTVNAASYNIVTIAALGRSTLSNYYNGYVSCTQFFSAALSSNYRTTLNAMWLDASSFWTASAWTADTPTCTSGSTGWVLFGTIAQTATADTDWTTTSNALTDDSNTADVVLDSSPLIYSEYLKFTNPTYGTTIPTDAASYSVQLRVKRVMSAGGGHDIRDLHVYFLDEAGATKGSDLAYTAASWPTTAATHDYTVTGATLDGTDFGTSSGFEISVDGSGTSNTTTCSIYVAWIKVTWACSGTVNGDGFFGAP